ncbi:hypothetical protein RHMOL_Rhmol12G0246700 [Rhododendron molle]|uniref:Uncharacterized protein n=1 Tax=Rhododendron molle TaxID=49168 RepID=A0ACC0LMY4_RHOML|nr:hypothetical protein RHMOL_Rhmol12G0246700 [Rhododendron molle]
MSATVISETMVMPTKEAPQTLTTKLTQIEVDSVECDCCGLTEECTPAYIDRIRARYNGKWICGLCAEAVKDEIVRCDRPMISTEEALTQHINFCKKFNSAGPPPNPAVHLISAMRQILRRRSDSPRSLRSMPCSPTKGAAGRGMIDRSAKLSRSESCIPALSLSLVDSPSFRSIDSIEEEEEGNK